jgi:hypothetical protein
MQMENNNNDTLVLLRDKIKRIINLFEASKAKNMLLEQQKKELNDEIIKLKKEKETLTIQYNNLKLAKTFEMTLDSSHDAKLKVNRIVREIDKCIALLNN